MEMNQEIEEIRRRLGEFQLKENEMWNTMTNGKGLQEIIDAEERHQRDAKFDGVYRDPKDGYAEDHKQSPVEKLRQDREDLALKRQQFRQDWESAEEHAKDERKYGQPGAWTNLHRDMSQANGEFRGHEREIRATPFSEPERQLLADTDPAAKPETKIDGGDGQNVEDSAQVPSPEHDSQPHAMPVRDVAAKWAEQQRQEKEQDGTAEKVNPPPLRTTLNDATKPADSKVEDGGKGDEGAPKNTPKEEPDVNPAAARALKTLEASKPSLELPAVRKFKV